MVPAAELKVLVGVYGIPEANKKLVKFDANLKALASSDPTLTLHADVDPTGFEELAVLKSSAEESVATTLRAEVDNTGWEEAGIKKTIFEDPATTTLQAEIDDLGFEEGALKKAIFADPVTTHLQAEATGFATVIAQLDAVRAMAKAPIVQEVKLRIDKSSLAELGAAEAIAGAANGNGNGHSNGNGDSGFLGALLGSNGGNGKGFLPTMLWGGHGAGGRGPWFMRALLGGGMLAGAGSLGSFAGFGAEHFLFTGLGLAGSAGAGLAGAGLLGAGALGTAAVGSGSDMAVMKSTIADTSELGKLYAKLQEQVALYGAHSKQAARASAQLHLAMREMGPAAKPELALAKNAEALDSFWDHQTQKARAGAARVLEQVVGLGHDYVPLVAHAAERNLAIVNKDLKPLFSWLEGPEGTGIFEHLENEFAHNLPSAMHATDQGVQLVLKTINVASTYTGGFIHTVDEFFTKWNEPQNFQKWEGEIGHLVGDFHLWLNLIKQAGTDIFDLFSQDAGTGKAIVVTITEMLHHLDEWERSTEGKAELHNLFVVHREEIVQLLHVIPPLIGAISPIYMTVAPFMTEAMTEVLGVVGKFLKTLDETGPITRWALGLGLIGGKLFGFKALFGGLGRAMWGPFESLLAKAPLIGGFFVEEETATEKLIGATEGLTGAVDSLTASYEAMGVAAQGATDSAAAAAGTATTAEIGAGVGAQTEAALGIGGGATSGAVGIGGAPLAAAAATGYVVLEMAAHRAGDASEKAIERLKQLDHEGKGLVGTIGHLGEGLPSWLRGGTGLEWAESGDKAHRLLQIMELMHLVGEKRSRQLLSEGKSLLDNLDLTRKQKAEYEHMLTKAQQANVQVEAHRGISTLESGQITRISDIKQVASHDAEEISLGWKEGSKGWRRATAENMLGVVDAVKAGEKAGLISAEEGQHEIAHYLREYHLVTGNDPLHIAEGFTSSWREAGRVSEAGISHALAELRKMPPVSQAIAEQTMLHQVKAFERGGELAKGTFSRLRSAIVTQLQQTREHGGAQVERFAAEFDSSFGMLSTNVAQALENIGGNVGALLAKLGAHNPLQNFTLHYLQGHGAPAGSGNKYLNQVPEFGGHQTGGFTVPGNSEGDRHPYMLPHGSFIMNREATAYGLQNGGMSPVMLESAERVFLPHEVAAIGPHNLAAINASVPRFQKGGVHGLGPEPHLQGQRGPLLDLGQHAIHAGYAAAQHYLGKHQPHGGALAYVPGGGGPVVAQMGHVLLADGFNRVGAAGPIGNAYRESGWNPAAIGTGGGGLFGFTSGEISLAALQAAARRAGVPWTDVGFQVEFMLRHGGASLRPRLNAARSPEESARIFMEEWERPGIPALGEREAAARKAFAMGYAEGGLIEQEEERLGVPGSKGKSKYSGAGYVFPFSHAQVNWGRIDEGVDFTGTGPIQAIGTGVVTRIMPDWYLHQKLIDYKLTEGPKAGQYIYIAEGIDSSLSVGQHVAAGEQIATFAHGTENDSIETGWGSAGGNGTLADGGSGATSAGQSFYGFLKELQGGAAWHGSGTGAFQKQKETVPGVFKGAHTHSLSFPGVPKTLHAIDREMRRWTRELRVYEAAAKAAKGRPELQRKLQANVTKIQKHLRELARARHKLRTQAARTHYAGHLAKQLGSLTGEEKSIELAQRAYNAANQRAEQIVDLEPTERILSVEASEADQRKAQEDYSHAYEAYVEGRERPAYAHVLETEAAWRNAILGAEAKASGLEIGWEGQIRSRMAQIASIEHFSGEAVRERDRVLKLIGEFKHDHPKAELPKSLREAREKMQRDLQTRKDLLEEVPGLRFQEHELRKVLGEGRAEFWGGYESQATRGKGAKAPAYLDAALADRAIQPPVPPLPGTGTFEQSLEEVQGLHWPGQHERLVALPAQRAAGFFGGAIWDTQASIEELGLKIQQAAASVSGLGAGTAPGAGNSERERLLEELLLQAHEREAIKAALEPTLAQFSATYPVGSPWMGAFENGGVALVGENGPELAHFPSGTRIHNASDTEQMLGGHETHVVVNGDIRQEPGDTRQPIEVWLRDPRNQKLVRQVVGTTPKATTTSGAGRAFRP